MKIQFLGTAAAEGIPGLFCACEKCKRARALGGRNLRLRSQALIDGQLLIDPGPDTLANALRFDLDLSNIRHFLVTHSHRDHFFPSDLYNLVPGHSHPPQDWVLRIYGNQEITGRIDALPQLETVCVAPFTPFAVGSYTVTALKARHATESPYVYAISDGSKTLLYGHDTDIFREETWEYIKSSGLHFDLVTMDCTEGAMEDLPYHGHMCLGRNKIFRDMLIEAGAADKNTVFICNHFSHNGKDSCYDDFAPQAEKEGFLTSYDGMILEV